MHARRSYDEHSRECTMFHFGIYRHQECISTLADIHFIFNLSMRESKAWQAPRPVVICLHHAGGRWHFRLGVSSSVGHCCQNFWVGWGPNQMKGGLRRGKCQRDKQALQIFLGRLQLDDADVVVYKGSKTPRPCCRAVERACFGCAWHLSP